MNPASTTSAIPDNHNNAELDHAVNAVDQSTVISQVQADPSNPPVAQYPAQPITTSGPSDTKDNTTSRNILGDNQRRESVSSSQRSQNASATNLAKTEDPNISSNSVTNNKSRKPAKSGFLSFLSCCNSSQQTQDMDINDAPRHRRQDNASSEKQTAPLPGAKETSLANGDEKAALSDPDVATARTQDATMRNVNQAPATAPTQNDGAAAGSMATVVPLPNVGNTLNVNTNAGQGLAASSPDVVVQAPTPILAQHDEDELIADRTTQQQALDTEIEMTDVGPTIPLSSDEADNLAAEAKTSVAATHEQVPAVSAQVADPLVEDETHIAPGLLPPVRPAHKGRKCLILDLDETLVHSSFKVNAKECVSQDCD